MIPDFHLPELLSIKIRGRLGALGLLSKVRLFLLGSLILSFFFFTLVLFCSFPFSSLLLFFPICNHQLCLPNIFFLCNARLASNVSLQSRTDPNPTPVHETDTSTGVGLLAGAGAGAQAQAQRQKHALTQGLLRPRWPLILSISVCEYVRVFASSQPISLSALAICDNSRVIPLRPG